MAVSWLASGAQSAQLAKQEKVDAEMRKETQGKMWRFFLKLGEEARVTFVDGFLDHDGFLTPPRYYEHQLQLNGSWNNFFVCPEKTAPHLKQTCPICATGDKPSLVSLFTIIDHREFKSSDGTKTYKDSPRLFVAKSNTMEILSKLAIKRNGLAGCTFDISRVGEQSNKVPGVGNMFDFVEKNDLDELRKKYIREVADPKTNTKEIKSFFVPANYEDEIVFRSAEELSAKFGFGNNQSSGYIVPSNEQATSSGGTDYSSQL